jgi:hypothetical protein
VGFLHSVCLLPLLIYSVEIAVACSRLRCVRSWENRVRWLWIYSAQYEVVGCFVVFLLTSCLVPLLAEWKSLWSSGVHSSFEGQCTIAITECIAASPVSYEDCQCQHITVFAVRIHFLNQPDCEHKYLPSLDGFKSDAGRSNIWSIGYMFTYVCDFIILLYWLHLFALF